MVYPGKKFYQDPVNKVVYFINKKCLKDNFSPSFDGTEQQQAQTLQCFCFAAKALRSKKYKNYDNEMYVEELQELRDTLAGKDMPALLALCLEMDG